MKFCVGSLALASGLVLAAFCGSALAADPFTLTFMTFKDRTVP